MVLGSESPQPHSPRALSLRAPEVAGDGAGPGSAGQDAYDLAGQVLARLRSVGHTVAVAESLTGGLVAAALTDIPGASEAFRGGVVAYATELKVLLLGVDRAMLARHGAVYAPVAAAMATGVRTRLGATYGVATTGVAARPGRRPAGGHGAHRRERRGRHGGKDHRPHRKQAPDT